MSADNSKLFNRTLYQTRRNRAAAGWADYDFLKRQAALRLYEKLQDITRTFPLALDLGCHKGELAETLQGQSGIKTWIQSDASLAMVREAKGSTCVCDEEFLPFAENTFDLVISALSLHHVNDLPGTLIQIQRCLKPDGLFLAVLPGANSLAELRESITQVSAEQSFPLSPRLSPLVEVRDAGALLMRAGFALPVVDSDVISVLYDDAFALMKELRGMGESNVLWQQYKAFTPRKHLNAIDAYYREHFARADGAIATTFEFVTLTGWKPHPSQQQPAKRGSGVVNLKQVL